MKKTILFLCSLLLISCTSNKKNDATVQSVSQAQVKDPEFRNWAKTPPMGWNSYNCYGAAVTEKEVRANADYMASKLKQYGWEYIVVDYCWSYPHPPGSIQNNPPQFRLEKDGAYVPWLAMDEFGRLYPDPRKFPSSQGNKGFGPLADYIHSLGLKFGIHVMRGIPRQAAWAKSPVKGAVGIDASMIADTASICPWLNQMFGVDMNIPGSQEYYNSLAELYASWGVDYIKMDDMDQSGGGHYHASEVEAMHKAIMNCGRPIVLSLSPPMTFDNRDHIKSAANLWRISDDFWDDWESLKKQFELADQWAATREPGNWPDADMLQLGLISRRGPNGPERESHFTEDEQYTHMTLWCIAQSPLMMGGDMPENSPFVEKLLTNKEVLDADQNAANARQLSREDGRVIWYSELPGSKDRFVAFFNLNEKEELIGLSFDQAGLDDEYEIHDLWNSKKIGSFRGEFHDTINPHGAKIYKLIGK